MDLLVEHSSKTDGVEPKTSLLRTNVGVEMKLPRSVSVHVTVEACDTEARLPTLAIIRRIEFFLWEGGD